MSYAARLEAAKDEVRRLFGEEGLLGEEAVSVIAERHSTYDPEAPWASNDLVEMDSDLAEWVFARRWSAEGTPVRG